MLTTHHRAMAYSLSWISLLQCRLLRLWHLKLRILTFLAALHLNLKFFDILFSQGFPNAKVTFVTTVGKCWLSTSHGHLFYLMFYIHALIWIFGCSCANIFFSKFHTVYLMIIILRYFNAFFWALSIINLTCYKVPLFQQTWNSLTLTHLK